VDSLTVRQYCSDQCNNVLSFKIFLFFQLLSCIELVIFSIGFRPPDVVDEETFGGFKTKVSLSNQIVDHSYFI